MGSKSAAFTVANNAISRLDGTTGVDRNDGSSIIIWNNSAVVVYIGDSAVSSTTGIPLPAGGSMTIAAKPGDGVYAIAASSTANVRVFQLGAS